MNVIIIEDEPNAARQLERLLCECDPTIKIVALLESVKTSVEWLNTHDDPNLIFLDIQLTDGLSFEIFEQCRINCPIIFCTAFDQYAIRAFKVNSIDYLLKPLEKEALSQSLSKFKNLQTYHQQTNNQITEVLKQLAGKPKSRFMVKYCQEFLSVDAEKVAYFNITHKIVNLITLEGKYYAVEHSLEDLENLLDANLFFRVNRQVIVSITAILNVEHDFGRLTVVISKTPKLGFSVSRDKTTAFKQWFGQ